MPKSDVWLVTGSARGLGRSIVAAALEARRSVVATPRSTSVLFGRIEVVVNNAGYADIASIEHTSLEAFRAQVDSVFYGTVNVTKAVLPVLRSHGSEFIIRIASVGGRITAPGLGAYQSAKFAVEGFPGVLQQEVGPLGIRVTVAEPGAMRTDWAGSSMTVPAVDAAYAASVGAFAERIRASSGRQPIFPA